MMRFLAVAGNSCLAIRSLMVFLTMFWLIKVRSLSTLPTLTSKESARISVHHYGFSCLCLPSHTR